MKRFALFFSFFLYVFVGGKSFCQNVVLTRNCSLSLAKSEIVAIKITISVYGDSVANEILMGRKYLPGPISIKFDGNYNVQKIVFYEVRGRKWDKGIKRKITKEIKKSVFFMGWCDHVYVSDEVIKAEFEKNGDSIIPFSCKANYHVLCVYSNREKILKERCHGDYKYIDFVKELIKEYDQKEIKDLDGNVYR